jgi:quercetin dioxygenase-like cupin family protein
MTRMLIASVLTLSVSAVVFDRTGHTIRSDHSAAVSAGGRADDAPTGLIVGADEGERMVRRWGYPMTIKVDPRNGGSTQLVAITEEVPPGKTIPLHRHGGADELVLLLEGSGIAILGNRRQAVSTGGIIFIPRNQWVGFENTGRTRARVFGVFSATGYEDYLRATSVPEGQPVVPMTGEEQAQIRSRFRHHIAFKEP